MATRNQLDKILSFLKTGKQLTVAEARKRFGVQRLAARIHDLRNDGFIVYTNKTSIAKGRVTSYGLDKSQRD